MADSPFDALLLVLESEAVRPRTINPLVPGPLEHICLRCLEKKPERRYASAGDLANDLERYLKGDALSLDTNAMGRRLEAWARRQPALAARTCTVLLCLGIVLTAYLLHPYTTLRRFWPVIGVLVAWLIVSFLCQLGVGNDRHARWVRYVWSGADPAALTAILLAAQGFEIGPTAIGPLLILYPTLIAASGFWFRVSLVGTTTLLAVAGYLLLLLHARNTWNVLAHWHILAVVGLIVTGLTVAYLVNRVIALTRFYERRPPGAP